MKLHNARLQARALARRIEQLKDLRIEYIDNPEFREPDAGERILGPAPPSTGTTARAPAGLPPYLASLYELPLLSPEEEVYYFRRMNYLKFLATGMIEALDSQTSRTGGVDRVEELLHDARETKNRIVRANLRLVISIARKYARPDANFFEMVSDGNVSLMRAIEKFDYGRGFKFSTYATWAIRKNFSRSIPSELIHRGRFRTGQSLVFETERDTRTSQFAQEMTHERQHATVNRLLEHLRDRDREILAMRFGLENVSEPMTLEEIGDRLGVSKERVRQIEKRALNHLREIAVSERLELPAV